MDFVKEKTERLAEEDLDRHMESFLEMRYYLSSNQSELLKRTSYHEMRNSSLDADYEFLRIGQKHSSKSATQEQGCDTPEFLSMKRAASTIVPERMSKEFILSPRHTNTGFRFAEIVEFLIIVQELTQVFLYLVKILLKAERNEVKRLALYGFLVRSDDRSGENTIRVWSTSTKNSKCCLNASTWLCRSSCLTCLIIRYSASGDSW